MPTELIVIDPDDGEAVQRVARALIAAICKQDPDWDRAIAYEISAHMRTALRAALADAEVTCGHLTWPSWCSTCHPVPEAGEVQAECHRELTAAFTPTHPAPTSTGAGAARDTQAAGGEGER